MERCKMSTTQQAQTPIILTDHYLKEATTKRGDDIVVQGVISRETLENIGFDTYQRDLGTVKQREKIFKALQQGKPLPPVELGMRGQKVRDTAKGLFLSDPVYCIDG